MFVNCSFGASSTMLIRAPVDPESDAIHGHGEEHLEVRRAGRDLVLECHVAGGQGRLVEQVAHVSDPKRRRRSAVGSFRRLAGYV